MNERLPALLAVIPLLALLSCTSTKFISTRTPSGNAPGVMQRVLVMGVSQDREYRLRFEDYFTAALRERGIAAFPSYALISCCSTMDANAVAAAVKEQGIDTVLVTRLVDVKDAVIFFPRTYGPYAADWWSYGFSRWGIYMPGYTPNVPPAVLETVLYGASGEDLKWRAVSRTVNQGGSPAQIRTIVKNTVQKMCEDGLMQ